MGLTNSFSLENLANSHIECRERIVFDLVLDGLNGVGLAVFFFYDHLFTFCASGFCSFFSFSLFVRSVVRSKSGFVMAAFSRVRGIDD